MSTIADTVNWNLPRGAEKYRTHIDRGIALLADREAGIVSALLAFAEAKSASVGEVRGFLADLGMTIPDDTPEPEVTDADVVASLSARFDQIEARLGQAIANAARRGVHV